MADTTLSSRPVRLSDATLGDLPEDVQRPTYNRDDLTPGIVHIGLGNFHRAHQAWYLHRLMQMGRAHDWAIIGAGVMAYDAEMRQSLLAQDCLTTLIELDPSGTSVEISGSMIDYVPIEEGNAPLIAAMTDPAIRIVSLTITEGGYYIDGASGEFDFDHPDIIHDAANPDHPRTAFGAMVAALRHRRNANCPAFTGLSCDNLQGNGNILRRTVVSLARMSDASLAEWIDANCSFPNSMVDCIVPATGPAERTLALELGIDDTVPVTHENYRQWVIEDTFSMGRPDWDLVGATLTHRVHDYETMKIRILNAGHQVVANVGELLSVPTIAECMADPDILGFFRKVERSEIAPHVAPVSAMTPEEYVDLIERRFANSAILDTTRRVAFDGSSRHSGFVLPILRDALVTGGEIEGLSLVEALWARMCAGTREDGTIIEANDPNWTRLQEVALVSREEPSAWLAQESIYGDLALEHKFSSAFKKWLTLIWTDGSRAALSSYAAHTSRL